MPSTSMHAILSPLDPQNHSGFTDFARQVVPLSQSAMNQGSNWSISLWSLFALLTVVVAPPADPLQFKVWDVVNTAVTGGVYSKFCYGFSTIIATGSVNHGSAYVHKGQKPNLHYQDCEVVVGNLVLTDLDAADNFDSIKIVTGYVHISNPGIPKVKLGGLQYVLGRELGTGPHQGAGLIIEGKPRMSYDKDNNKGTFEVELPNLQLSRGGISLDGLLPAKLDPRQCPEAQAFYAGILGVDKSNVMQRIIFGKELRHDEANTQCAAHTHSAGQKISICREDQGYTTITGCGTCSDKNLAGFCVGSCPPGLLQYGKGCYFTCPAGTEIDDQIDTSGVAKCKPCDLSFNPGTNKFGYCRRSCFTGFMLPLTLLQFREFYLNPQQGGMRSFKQTMNAKATGHCTAVNGNIVLQAPAASSRWIPANHMFLMSSVSKVTGMVMIDEVFVPSDTFQLLESAWIGVQIKKTVAASITLPFLQKGTDSNLAARLSHVTKVQPNPKPPAYDNKADKQMYVPAQGNGNANCKDGAACKDGKCAGSGYCYVGCLAAGENPVTTLIYENRPITFCTKPKPEYNTYLYLKSGIQYSVPCNVECDQGCIDSTTFSCTKCRYMTLSTFNLKTCLSVCPHGFYTWMNRECRRCAPECGNNGCYNKGSTEGEEGCKKCDVSFLSRSEDGIYRIQCGFAGSSGYGANYIEQAFDEFYPKPASSL